MSKTDDFAKRIAAAKLDLNTALLTGSPTAALRGALRALESEKAAIDAAAAERQANQDAAQQALATIERQRINDAAKTLLEARNGRIAAIATRFPVRPIPDVRSSSRA